MAHDGCVEKRLAKTEISECLSDLKTSNEIKFLEMTRFGVKMM